MGWSGVGSYQFGGGDYFSIAPSATTNFTDSITWGTFLQGGEDGETLGGKVVVGEEPTDPVNAQYYVRRLTGGYAEVWLHTTTKSCVFVSTDPILNNPRIIHFMFRWNLITKTFQFFVDAVPKGYTINDFGNTSLFHSAVSTMTNLTDLPTALNYVGYTPGTGVVPYTGLVYRPFTIYPVAISNVAINTLYNTYKPDENMQPVAVEKIIATSNYYSVSPSAYSLVKMNPKGGQLALALSSNYTLEWPRFSKDYSKIAYIDAVGNYFAVIADADLGNPVVLPKPSATFYARYIVLNHNNTEALVIYNDNNTNTDEVWSYNLTNMNAIAISNNSVLPNPNLQIDRIFSCDYNQDSTYIFYLNVAPLVGSDSFSIYSLHVGSQTLNLIDNSTGFDTSSLAQTPSVAPCIRCSPNGQKIGFTKRVADERQVFIMDAPLGGNLLQVTSLVGDCVFNDFDPTSSKILFTYFPPPGQGFGNGSTNGQLYTCNLNGSNLTKISANDSFSYQQATWGNIV